MIVVKALDEKAFYSSDMLCFSKLTFNMGHENN